MATTSPPTEVRDELASVLEQVAFATNLLRRGEDIPGEVVSLIDELDTLLNKRSGMLGLSGVNDFRELRRLIDDGFQAFNAGRLSEACRIFTGKMLAPEHDTTIGLTLAGALTPAGLGGCVIELMERGLVDFVISTGANLYHDLHYALNFTLHRGSPFLDDVELYEQGIIRIYDVLFPATVLLETGIVPAGLLAVVLNLVLPGRERPPETT
jgi:deoxyhypusine synthase